MTPEQFEELKKFIKANRSNCGCGFLTILFILFLGGCFKGCGY